MSKLLSVVLSLVGFAVMVGFQNCGGQPPSSSNSSQGTAKPSAVTMTGTVQKGSATQPLIDGCKVLICSYDNVEKKQVCVIPVKFDTSTFNNGDVVEIEGVVRTDMVSTCMAGEIVQIATAKVISPAGPSK